MKCSPGLISGVICALYTINPAYASTYPELFRRHIPELVERTSLDMLDQLKEEAKAMLADEGVSEMESETDWAMDDESLG